MLRALEGWLIPALLIGATAVSILSTDLYLPSIPHLPALLDTTPAAVQLTLGLNLLGFALGQLVHGPLADRFGRRLVMLSGMVGFVALSLGCALASSIEWLITARLLQGALGSVEAVVALAVIGDLYDDERGVRVLGVYGVVASLAPAIGPVIGGYVFVAYGWRANFFLVTGLALAMTLLIARHLPETGTPDPHALSMRRLAGGYARLVTSRRYITHALMCGAVMAGLFAFVAEAPFVLIDRLGVATEHYGFYHMALVAAFTASSLVASRLGGVVPLDRLMLAGLVCVAFGGLALPAALWAGHESALGLTAAIAVDAFGLGLVFATAPMRALHTTVAGRGSASALLGAIEWGGGAVGAWCVTLLHDGTGWPLAIMVATTGILALALFPLRR